MAPRDTSTTASGTGPESLRSQPIEGAKSAQTGILGRSGALDLGNRAGHWIGKVVEDGLEKGDKTSAHEQLALGE